MKSLLISLLLFAFAQGAQAAFIELDESQSKKLYNVLASFGLRMPFPLEMLTRAEAEPAVCVKIVNAGASYTCEVEDEHHGGNVVKTGAPAKKLYDFLAYYTGISCEGSTCRTESPEVKCVYLWPNKDNPPPRRYLCTIERIPGPN